ncbi:zinc finger protein 184-like [Teleopsis dalmanni]|uniref:zinc finger protein 184-like n=1 Tax=Teleopsis dalmanni TaxID=139649 RepID=UPI0018CDA3D2|nr:zinc finger protein 184-like [Teleopsis dalmanni]
MELNPQLGYHSSSINAPYYQCKQCSRLFSDLIEETKSIAASDITLPYRVLTCPLTTNIDNDQLEDLQSNELNDVYKGVLVKNSQKNKNIRNAIEPKRDNVKVTTVYPLSIVKSPLVLEIPNEVQKIRRHPCDMCNKTFGNRKSMMLHRRTHCDSQRSTFVCPEAKCGRIYSSKQACDVHVKQVHQKDGLVCSVCNKRFAIIQTLEVHMRYHTGDFPFGCNLCDKKFAQKGHLTTHMQVKHNNLRYFCTENGCGKVFKNSVSLRNHRYVHSSMPFSCEYCKKGYPQKAKLKTHISSRHGIKKTLEDLESMRVFKDARTRHSLFEIQAQFTDETEGDANKMGDNNEEDDLIV